MIQPRRTRPFRHWSIARLRVVLGISFLLLVVPTVVLSLKAHQQIKWEALYQQRQLAEELIKRINDNVQRWVEREQARPAAQYKYVLNQNQQNQTGYLQRSPLSQWPSNEGPPGLIGYFEVDSQGRLSSPLLPASDNEALSSGLTPTDIDQRSAVKQAIEAVLSQNELVAPPVDGVAASADDYVAEEAQASFDMLSKSQPASRQAKTLGKTSELNLERDFADAEPTTPYVQAEKKERVARMKNGVAAYSEAEPAPPPKESASDSITLFKHTTSPFSLSLLDSGHLILFRYAWIDNQRLVQGILIDQNRFIENSVQQIFQQSSLAQHANLTIAYRGNVLRILAPEQRKRFSLDYDSISARDVKGTLLLQSSLSSPLAGLELIFSSSSLPDGPGGIVITWASALLLLLLVIVFGLLYHFGVRQIRLLQQQQNFIASVSHELKTPLTSIRMFSEILMEGWTPQEKQQEYFRFISDESERLSRLITNVLQLARMERQELQLDIKPITVKQVIDLLNSRLESQLANTDFSLNTNIDPALNTVQIAVDPDAIMQVMMNLIDNSLKFCKDAKNKTIELNLYQSKQSIVFEVRDFGPGIPSNEQPKVFDLFYRVGNELTRSSQGTGIGLALVQQLISEMGGSIEYVQQDIGACFRIRLPMDSNSDT